MRLEMIRGIDETVTTTLIDDARMEPTALPADEMFLLALPHLHILWRPLK